MFNQRIRHVMEPIAQVTVSPDGSVADAAQLMVCDHVTAVLVVDAGQALRGIFTPIDAVRRVIARGLDPRATPLSSVMTRDPHTVGPDTAFGRALRLMQEHGWRQLPVVEAGRVVGIVHARVALDPELEEFAVEAQRRDDYSVDAA